MTEFDPDIEPETGEQADAYVNWCAENFMRISQAEPRTFRTAVRAAAWLFVVASAQFHLHDEVDQDAEALLEQLARYHQLGRAIERQSQRFPVEQLIVLRSSLDCWEPVGHFAGNLLAAAKCAVSAMILIELHPLIDLWELDCPDVWALLVEGSEQLVNIGFDEFTTFGDFSVRRDESAVAKFTWQRANNLARNMGAPPLSEN